MMHLDSEAIDINQLQQIMRLTGTPPASLISRMPSHEVRHVPSAFPGGPHLPAGLRSPASTHSTVYKPILLDPMLYYEVFIIIYHGISLRSQSIYSLSALWLTALVSARLCQCILMSFCMLTHWFWKWHNVCIVCNLGRKQIFKHALPEGCTVIKLTMPKDFVFEVVAQQCCTTVFLKDLFTFFCCFVHLPRRGTTLIHFHACRRGTLLMCLLVPTLSVNSSFTITPWPTLLLAHWVPLGVF